ncbi:MAG: TetR/AcrR family transcriptional regulator [Marmoricola sp.]|nr:TetR/AcrR family transcriptional regulator [Marmoricola sp.]
MSDTKQKLLDGTVETLRTKGIAGTSARAIATAAGVNQALVFYHFGSVDQLIDAACRDGAGSRVDEYHERFSKVASLRELLELGRALHTEESARGNVAVMAQVLAGAQQDEALAPAGRHALSLWITEIETVLARLLVRSPVAEAIDVPGLARAVSAAFVGLELYDGVDDRGADQAFAALEQFAVLIEVAEDLGPVARRALRSRLRKARSKP